MMRKFGVVLYGLLACSIFITAVIFAVRFFGDYTINRTGKGTLATAIIVNVFLMLLFAAQHTIMSRQAFKTWWTKIIPPVIERSTFVLLASTTLLLLFWCWQPLDQMIWQITNPFGQATEVTNHAGTGDSGNSRDATYWFHV